MKQHEQLSEDEFFKELESSRGEPERDNDEEEFFKYIEERESDE